MDDRGHKPDYYISESGISVWNVIEAFCSDLSGAEAYDTGNILKYACRWKKKNGVKDLYKIKEYTEHLIKLVKENENEK